jgi:hypothetical protein
VTGLTDMRQIVEMYRSAVTDMRGGIDDWLRRATKSHAVGLGTPLTKAT